MVGDVLTIKDLYELCEKEIKLGNGNMVIMTADDYEGNGFHYIYYPFCDVDRAGAEEYIDERIAKNK